MARMPLHPKHPERVCWGCEKYCPVNHLCCRETRVEHPVELFGEDWNEASKPPSPPVREKAPKRRKSG